MLSVLAGERRRSESVGSLSSLETLYEEHVRGLLVFARSILGDRARAEDAVHHAFALLARDGTAHVEDTRAYLYGAVRHAALNVARGENRHARASLAASASRAEAIFDEPAGELERRESLGRAIAALPEAEREAVVMKVWGGLTFEEIGRATETPAPTAASRYRAALRRLPERLGEMGWP
jgi:RNA polymerase sigma-70 factor (ECF subfamily)